MISTNIRFPEKELHKAIVASAKKNRRSFNSEMLRAIEFYLENAPEAKTEQTEKKEQPAKTTK